MQLCLRKRAPVTTAAPTLLTRARAGDPAAAEELIAAHVARIGAIVGAILGPAHPDVPDAVQETFLRALNQLGQCRSEAAFPVWLTRIAQNVCRNRRKSAWAQRVAPGTVPEDSTERADWATALDLRAAIERLREEDRIAVVLHDAHGYTCDEIGALLGLSAEAVRSRIRRARTQLRTILGPQWEEELA